MPLSEASGPSRCRRNVIRDWLAVIAAGKALPGVDGGTFYGKPALKFRGKTLAATIASDQGGFVLRVASAEVDATSGMIVTHEGYSRSAVPDHCLHTQSSRNTGQHLVQPGIGR